MRLFIIGAAGNRHRPLHRHHAGAGRGADQGEGRRPAFHDPRRAHGRGVRRELDKGRGEHRRQGARFHRPHRQAKQERRLPGLLQGGRAQRQGHEPDEGVGIQDSL